MKTQLRFLMTSLMLAVLSFGAQAQPASGANATTPAGACAKARDPQRCEALQQAKETCKDKAGADKRQCMNDAMPPMDCSKARNPARCEAHQKAKAACKDKTGQELRQCMRDQTSAAKRSQNEPPKN